MEWQKTNHFDGVFFRYWNHWTTETERFFIYRIYIRVFIPNRPKKCTHSIKLLNSVFLFLFHFYPPSMNRAYIRYVYNNILILKYNCKTNAARRPTENYLYIIYKFILSFFLFILFSNSNFITTTKRTTLSQ